MLVPIRMGSNCSDSQIPRGKSRDKSLFNQLGRHVNTASRKSLAIQGQSITKPRTHSEESLYGCWFSAALIHN